MYTAGIDIGGTNTRIALIDEAYEIIQRIQFPTDVNNPHATLQKIQETVQSFSVAIAGVGLSCPGPFEAGNYSVHSQFKRRLAWSCGKQRAECTFKGTGFSGK